MIGHMEVASAEALGSMRKCVCDGTLRPRQNMKLIDRRILDLQYLLPSDKWCNLIWYLRRRITLVLYQALPFYALLWLQEILS